MKIILKKINDMEIDIPKGIENQLTKTVLDSDSASNCGNTVTPGLFESLLLAAKISCTTGFSPRFSNISSTS